MKDSSTYKPEKYIKGYKKFDRPPFWQYFMIITEWRYSNHSANLKIRRGERNLSAVSLYVETPLNLSSVYDELDMVNLFMVRTFRTCIGDYKQTSYV